jgi:tRNA (adenine-N(1)-)-methyltransferase non-catalytic subunit
MAKAEVVEEYGALRSVIQSGDVVLISGGDVKRLVRIHPNQKTKLCKSVVDLGSLIGQRFGQVYELQERTGKLVLSMENPDLDRSEVEATANDEVRKDNRGLEDTHGANQLLDHEAVRKIREAEGAKNVVQKLVESSATFETKTSFAQEKYVKKKKAKYAVLFKVDRVNPVNLSDIRVPTYNPDTSSSPDDSKFLPLRVDTVAQIIHYGGIRHNSRIMLYDDTNGVLPAAILSRLGAEGVLYQVLHQKQHAQMSLAQNMCLPDIKRRWRCIPYEPLLDPSAKMENPPNFGPYMADAAESGAAETTTDEAKGDSQWISGKKADALFKERPVDALIVATFEPGPIVADLQRHLGMSGSVVLYSSCAQLQYRAFPIVKRFAIDVRIFDSWYREYQVLPGRTHPTVTMSSTGGFILVGIKAQSPQNGPAEEEQQGEGQETEPTEKESRKRSRDE